MDIKWKCCYKKIQDRDVLVDLLPPQFKYSVSQYELKEENVVRKEAKFEVKFDTNICTEAQWKTFLTQLSGVTNTNWNSTTNVDKRKWKNIFLSGARKCLHNIRKNSDNIPDRVPNKNTICPSKLKFRILKSNDCEGCADVCSNPKFLCTVTLSYLHNHSIDCAQASMFQPVSDSTKARFQELFEAGHGTSSAYHSFKKEFLSHHQEDYLRASASRRDLPDYRWVSYAYEQYVKTRYSDLNSPETFRLATEQVRKYNELHKSELAVIHQFPTGEYYVAVADTFHRRVHTNLKQSGDICVVDGTSNLDLSDSKYYRFITCSPAGGLPIGWIVCSNESEEMLTAAFGALRDILPDDAFYGRSTLGPKIFLTDDAASEIAALKNIWPEATHLLCQWHCCQAVWRWLWSANHSIAKSDRPVLMKLFTKMVYSHTMESFDEAEENFNDDDVLQKYPGFATHIHRHYIARREKWSMYSRKDLSTHNVNTSNICECSFRILKENLMDRTKARNIVELLEILFNENSSWYVQRLIDLGNSRISNLNVQNSRYKPAKVSLSKDKIFPIHDTVYMVQSEKDEEVFYNVDMR